MDIHHEWMDVKRKWKEVIVSRFSLPYIPFWCWLVLLLDGFIGDVRLVEFLILIWFHLQCSTTLDQGNVDLRVCLIPLFRDIPGSGHCLDDPSVIVVNQDMMAYTTCMTSCFCGKRLCSSFSNYFLCYSNYFFGKLPKQRHGNMSLSHRSERNLPYFRRKAFWTKNGGVLCRFESFEP